MKAVVTVIGHDRVGIIANISQMLSGENINILDISQTIMKDLFTMIMLVDLSQSKAPLKAVSQELERLGKEMGLSVQIQPEDLFHAMQRI